MPRQTKGRRSSGRRSTGRQKGDPKLPKVEGTRLQSPTIDWTSPPTHAAIPDTKDLVKLDVAQRYAILQRFGVSPSWERLRNEAASYVTRMTQYPPNSEAWKAEVAKLSSLGEDNQFVKRALLGANRTAYRQFEILSHAKEEGINLKTQEYVRVMEGDEHTCAGCISLAGEEGTMEYHAGLGLPGPSSCEGGAYCRCSLIPVE